jgi:hypothetical protein
MQQIISQEALLTQRYKESGSVLQIERIKLQETLSKITSNGDTQRGNLSSLSSIIILMTH